MPRGEFYEVRKLLGKRKLANNRVEYLVRWKGYSKKHDTWEPLANLNTCMDLVQAFNAELRTRSPTTPNSKVNAGVHGRHARPKYPTNSRSTHSVPARKSNTANSRRTRPTSSPSKRAVPIDRSSYPLPKRTRLLRSQRILDELRYLLEQAARDSTSIVVFRSIGNFFCTGLSVKSFCDQVDSGKILKEVAERYTRSLRNFVNCLIDFSKPLIAIVQGPAVGLGCAMLPHFDTVYCSERAYFSVPYTDIGQTPEACSSYLFPKIFGHSMANDMLLNGRVISAIEAKSASLVSQVCHHDSLEKNILPLLKQLTMKSLEALLTTKELIRNPERSRLKHVNQCEYDALKGRWEDKETLKHMKKYLERIEVERIE